MHGTYVILCLQNNDVDCGKDSGNEDDAAA